MDFDQRVVNITRTGEDDGRRLFRLQTLTPNGPQTYIARYVVLALGASSKQNQLSALPEMSLAAHEGMIDMRLGDPHKYRNAHVIVVGSGPSGLEMAVRLCSYGAAQVTKLMMPMRRAISVESPSAPPRTAQSTPSSIRSTGRSELPSSSWISG